MNALRQFEFAQLEALMAAMHSGKELKNIVKDGRPLEKYPAFSPIYALNTIVDNIKEINQFQGHQGYVISVSFSPDGKTIATASDDNTARLWPVRYLDRALKDGCVWLQDYLQNNTGLSEEERRLCDDI
ncbi:WD40 repeat domain-containing protein [Okeanomitos corallinicola TIOX110]|uniref:WD40 repeat domain-containing protein n=1 Tax=Okeanomitos corallinicola TIOX110 TaxID=3133117 RepID=A0ABZ2UW66_9CYAN